MDTDANELERIIQQERKRRGIINGVPLRLERDLTVDTSESMMIELEDYHAKTKRRESPVLEG